ncbi:hypothetical protein TWF481_007216 [Arthrobotrys musiformis]|uniref:Uncharacterized protein n=1 Tax=Arthrobotrys musiformis TaxID=47236 RepID=A0AAV9WBS7_9PEZI
MGTTYVHTVNWKTSLFDGDTSSALSDEVFGTMETGLHTVQIRVTSGKRPFSGNRADTSDSENGSTHQTKRQRLGEPVSVHDFIEFAPSHDHQPRPSGGTHLSSQESLSSGKVRINGVALVPGESSKSIDRSSFETLTRKAARTDYVSTQGFESTHPPAKIKKLQVESEPIDIEIRRAPPTVPSLRISGLKLEELPETSRQVSSDADSDQQGNNNQIGCECGVEAENIDSYDLSDTLTENNLGSELAHKESALESLRFGFPVDADGAVEQQEEELCEVIAIGTPRSAIKTSDMLHHLKAGNWT